jgi:hypothetical protein
MKRAYEPECNGNGRMELANLHRAAVDEVVDLAANLDAVIGDILEP